MGRKKIKKKDRIVSVSYSMKEADHSDVYVIGGENRSKGLRLLLKFWRGEIKWEEVEQ